MTVLDAIKAAFNQWVEAFNVGDAAGIAATYEADAVMYAKPSGTFVGVDEIREC